MVLGEKRETKSNTNDRGDKTERQVESTYMESSLETNLPSSQFSSSRVVAGDVPTEEPPTKRIRTRSMDAAEEESIYSMNRYRISPETIGILNSKGITELFPIQALTFDSVYDGKDLIGRAPTGQGKTLAFALPIVEKIYKLGLTPPRRSRAPLTLVLSPTRELAQQIDEQIHMVAPHLRSVCLYVFYYRCSPLDLVVLLMNLRKVLFVVV